MHTAQRIKYLRKKILHLTQEEFSKSINMSRSNLCSIELGKVNLTDRVAKDICKEYKINFLWLTEGLGEPLEAPNEDIFDEIQREYSLNNKDILILKEYSTLTEMQRERLNEYIMSLIELEKKKKD